MTAITKVIEKYLLAPFVLLMALVAYLMSEAWNQATWPSVFISQYVPLVMSAILVAGAFIRSFSLINKPIGKKDVMLVFGLMAFSMLVVITGVFQEMTPEEIVQNFHYLSVGIVLLFSIFLAWALKKRILDRITVSGLVAYYLIFAYLGILYDILVLNVAAFFVLGVVSLCSYRKWSGFWYNGLIYVLYLLAYVGLGIFFTSFGSFFLVQDQVFSIERAVSVFVFGSMIVSILVHVMFLLDLIPDTRKNKSFKQALQESKQDLFELSANVTGGLSKKGLIVIAVLAIAATINLAFPYVAHPTFILCSIFLIDALLSAPNRRPKFNK